MVKMINDGAALWQPRLPISASLFERHSYARSISQVSLDTQRSHCHVWRLTAGPSSDGYLHRC